MSKLIVTSVTVTPTLGWIDEEGDVTPAPPIGAITCGLSQLAEVTDRIRADLPRIEREAQSQVAE
jgi:hypothetical protein